MAKESVEWEKVSLKAKKVEKQVCTVVFRATGQVILSAETMNALDAPQYINLFVSPKHNLIAMQATSEEDQEAIRISKTVPAPETKVMFTNKAIYAWLAKLVGKDDVTISLTGKPSENSRVVFDLKKANIKPKQTRRKKTEAILADDVQS